MLTGDRPRLACQAIWYFLSQDYAERELVVVDGGRTDVAAAVPEDPRIRYVRLAAASPGRKRNLACELATGELILHWHDDAWYSSDRISRQVAQFASAEVQAAGLNAVLHYQPLTGGLWRYAAPTARPHAATLAYRRTRWEAQPFAEDVRDEIAPFLRGTLPSRLDVRDASGVAVSVLHGSSTGAVNVADRRWQPRPFHELGSLLKLDLGFYATLRRTAAASIRPPPIAPITLAATFMVYDGYGSMAEYLALGLARSRSRRPRQPVPDRSRVGVGGVPRAAGAGRDPTLTASCSAMPGGARTSRGSATRATSSSRPSGRASRLPADWPARLNEATRGDRAVAFRRPRLPRLRRARADRGGRTRASTRPSTPTSSGPSATA